MITINQVVINKKNQRGTITKIITKSTGYVQVAFENGIIGKEMAFNLTDENGISLKKSPEKKAQSKTEDPISSWANIALSVNDKLNRNAVWKLAEAKFGRIDAQGNDFISSLLDSMFNRNTLSEKQAYCLAKFCVETGQLS